MGLATASARERNAVVIQADLGGAVMPGVVFAVDKDIPIFTVQPLTISILANVIVSCE